VVAMKADAKGVRVLTHDNSLSVVTAAGKLSSSRGLPADKIEQTKKDLAAASDAEAEAGARKQERADRILKLSASSGGKMAVAWWGGTLRVVDKSGKVLTQQQLPQDVTALAWLDGKVVVGLADGRVVALAVGK
jgi:hypothetical protein